MPQPTQSGNYARFIRSPTLEPMFRDTAINPRNSFFVGSVAAGVSPHQPVRPIFDDRQAITERSIRCINTF